ncbi:unnamed protein product [Polarella glacialis]|uniref:Uncharacterized protein n=1 Tax=Polarella glacialis TaxID=89957 RepID=A0A813JTL5_POLGL|nr:unnamed protein product [Polarella glacialis]
MAFSRSRLLLALAATATSVLAAGFEAGTAGGPVAQEELPEALAADDSCDETCELSLRQLRGELRRAAVGSHEVDNGETEDVPDPGDYPKGDEDGEEKTNMTVAAAGNTTLQTSGPLRGAFCCQNGQGLGYTNADDIGGSCYPSAKVEVGGYCDSPYHCSSKCNGTWVEGYLDLLKFVLIILLLLLLLLLSVICCYL